MQTSSFAQTTSKLWLRNSPQYISEIPGKITARHWIVEVVYNPLAKSSYLWEYDSYENRTLVRRVMQRCMAACSYRVLNRLYVWSHEAISSKIVFPWKLSFFLKTRIFYTADCKLSCSSTLPIFVPQTNGGPYLNLNLASKRFTITQTSQQK